MDEDDDDNDNNNNKHYHQQCKNIYIIEKLSMYIFVFFGDGDTICTRQEV